VLRRVGGNLEVEAKVVWKARRPLELVKIGYGSPRVTRHLHPSGYNDVLVYNVDDLLKLDKVRDAARIGASVGRRKRIQILKKAKELNIKVLNP
jgi:large subunit ribosomal protein L32e